MWGGKDYNLETTHGSDLRHITAGHRAAVGVRGAARVWADASTTPGEDCCDPRSCRISYLPLALEIGKVLVCRDVKASQSVSR
ncbi:hypothetical protein O3P69_015853 [Scylla paramamosain]|uniref:Uncharacterized protein n=1 Tax=Scylla paramamosain TaxID=85552 RepID=A0AAW0T897_SCYPA